MMANAQQMLQTHPREIQVDQVKLAAAIEAILACAQTCEACADACLGEKEVQSLVGCIRTDLDCAAVCRTTVTILTRQTETSWKLVRAQLEACIAACQVCADHCAEHAEHHEHCRICAETCRHCEQACSELLSALLP